MPKKKRYLVFVFCGFSLALAAAAGLVHFTWLQKRRVVVPPALVRPVAKGELEILLRRKFARCGHDMEEKKAVTEGNLALIGRFYQGWRIGSADGEWLTLIRSNEGHCPICEREEFIGVLDGKVAIFHGRPERKGPLKEVTAIEVDKLPRQEQADLEKGLVIRTDKEKLQLMEGLAALLDG